MTRLPLPKRFLFRLAAPCRHLPLDGELTDHHRLLDFGQLEERRPWAEVRAGWNERGLTLACIVSGKEQPPWCRRTRPEESDGAQFFIDTRDVHNVHRASRFCHRFLIMPLGNGPAQDQPIAQWLPIHRAREHPRAIGADQIRVASDLTDDGYAVHLFLSAESLTGFDPTEHPHLGFTYSIADRELREQTFGPGSPLPHQDDPSLWPTLDLLS